MVDSSVTEIAPQIEYGYYTDSFNVFKGVIKRDQFLSDILLKYNVPYATIHELSVQSKEIYDVRKLGRGKEYTIFCAKDSAETALSFVYQANEIDYVIYDFSKDSVEIKLGQKPITIQEKFVKGSIKSSLYESLRLDNQDIMLTFEMADIYAWTIDFYRLQPGDHYRIYYKEKLVDGKSIGIDRIESMVFNHEGRDFKAYYFEQDSIGDYFDEHAESLRKAFLKSPLKFSRLSSGYTRRRFHPVQKRWKAHLGTDYAAPNGTPIRATGDGKVVEATYKRYNGNYVKIKHNSTYLTQYLHMSRIGKGIKPGKFVQQGEIIGYVGSTGLATGPHVCYRFWKNGAQVNHLREEFPPSEPVKDENLSAFKAHISGLNQKINIEEEG